MAKYIKKKHLKDAVQQLPWYHINKQGELVEGAHGDEDALVKYSHIKAIVKGLPTKKIAEQTEPNSSEKPNNCEPQTDEEQFCREHKCPFYRPQDGGCDSWYCRSGDEPQIYGNEYNCIMTMFGECSYAETGCGDCAVVEKVRKALEQTEPQTDCPKSCPSRDICTKDATDCAWGKDG